MLEVILQEVARGSRVLAASASNIAVDNLVERLAAAAPKLKLVRLGHPARLLPQVGAVQAYALAGSDGRRLLRSVRDQFPPLHCCNSAHLLESASLIRSFGVSIVCVSQLAWGCVLCCGPRCCCVSLPAR